VESSIDFGRLVDDFVEIFKEFLHGLLDVLGHPSFFQFETQVVLQPPKLFPRREQFLPLGRSYREHQLLHHQKVLRVEVGQPVVEGLLLDCLFHDVFLEFLDLLVVRVYFHFFLDEQFGRGGFVILFGIDQDLVGELVRVLAGDFEGGEFLGHRRLAHLNDQFTQVLLHSKVIDNIL
jgi:hypothetical protein